jgi:predicted dehydrogenase
MDLALIGCGSRGNSLAAAAQVLGHRIAVCCDSSSAAARRAAKRFGGISATGASDALLHVDAIVISDPDPADYAIASRALNKGTHVYWAGPLAPHGKHARRMLDAAKDSGAALLPAYPNRACPQFAAAAAQVSARAIGRVGFVRVHRCSARTTGVGRSGPSALSSLAGDIDWIASTFGHVRTVFAQVVHEHPVDAAMLTLTLGDGPIVQCVASAATNRPDRASVELCGKSGMIQFNTHEPILTVAKHSGGTGRAASQTSPLSPPVTWRALRLFFTAVDSGRTHSAQLAHERHVVGVFDSALDSARAGRTLRVRR